MTASNEFLVSIHGVSGDGVVLLEKIYSRLHGLTTSIKSSSVYRVRKVYKHSKHIHDIRTFESYDGLVAVTKGSTDMELLPFFEAVKTIEKDLKSELLHRSVNLFLLIFSDQVLMTPELTIPYPEFHRKPEEIVLGAELWGNYMHPILKQDLNHLARKFIGSEWGEFYRQGLRLEDIKEPNTGDSTT
ncbi:MAG: hypothetical protein KDD61_17850 [Bdellovibrionales bacterium]|nr:hypothetical protein [Bdellovibrionales bacterium]